MPREIEYTGARLSKHLLDDYDAHRNEWAQQVALDFDYFCNKQWTDEEQQILDDRGQTPLVINRITPVALQKIAQLGEHRPKIKALPMNRPANKKADVWSHMIEYVLYNSKFRLVDLAVKQAHVTKSVGYYYAFIDEAADDGKGEVMVRQEQPEFVWVDPNAREPDFSDADHILIAKEITMNQAIQRFPEKKRALRKAAMKESTQAPQFPVTDSYNDEGYFVSVPQDINYTPVNDELKVLIIERYSRIIAIEWLVRNVDGKFMRQVSDEVYQRQFASDPAWSAVKIRKRKILKVVSAGERTLIGQWILPTEHYPIIPVPNYWTGTPYPLSDIRYLRGMQDEINKRRSLMILNAALSSSNKWLYEKGSIDEDFWDMHAALPNAKLPYKAGYNQPLPVQPLPLPAALAYLEETAKHDMEYMAGSFPVSHGDASQAPPTYAATLALEEFGARRLNPSLEMLAHAKTQLGKVIIDYCQHLYKTTKFIRILGNKEGELVEFYINERRFDPVSGDTYTVNGIDSARYDVIIESGMNMPTNRWARFMAYKDLFQMGAIDNQALLEQSDLPDREDIIARLSQIVQLNQALSASAEEKKELQGLVMSMRRQVINADIRAVVAEYRSLEKAKLLDIEAKARLVQAMMELQAKSHALDMEDIERQAKAAAKVQAAKDQMKSLPAPSKE
jgi:hypothetical protein